MKEYHDSNRCVPLSNVIYTSLSPHSLSLSFSSSLSLLFLVDQLSSLFAITRYHSLALGVHVYIYSQLKTFNCLGTQIVLFLLSLDSIKFFVTNSPHHLDSFWEASRGKCKWRIISKEYCPLLTVEDS